MGSFYDLFFTTNAGYPFSFSELRGKKVLVVNTASACGYTPQYASLEALYARFSREELEIIAFPSDDFGGQEPGSDPEIATFCAAHFGIHFPLMTKSHVTGPEANAVFRWLAASATAAGLDPAVTWNFQKFAIGPSGQLEQIFAPGTDPLDPVLEAWLTRRRLA